MKMNHRVSLSEARERALKIGEDVEKNLQEERRQQFGAWGKDDMDIEETVMRWQQYAAKNHEEQRMQRALEETEQSEIEQRMLDLHIENEAKLDDQYRHLMNATHEERRAKTSIEPFDLTQIPFDVLRRMGAVAREGEAVYGRNNWRKGVGDRAFQLERLNHAVKHLYLAIHALEFGETLGEPGEDDMAKVLVNVSMVMELLRMEAAARRLP